MIKLRSEDLEKAVIEIREKGEKLAKSEATYEYLKSMIKVRKAELILENANNGMTYKDRECMAESHSDITQMHKNIRMSKEEVIKLRHQIDSIKESCNLFRTESANERGEKKLYGELG